MGRYAKQGNNAEEFQNAPAGTHLARCFKLVDLGTQHDEFEGKEIIRNKVLIFWELSSELMDDGQPFIVTKFYTNSLHKKSNLRHDLEQWRGEPFSENELEKFDLEKILGLCCLISIVEKPAGKGIKVGSVMSLPKGTTSPSPVNSVFSFWIDEWDQDKFEKLSDGIQKIIGASDEVAVNAPGSSNDTQDDADIPF